MFFPMISGSPTVRLRLPLALQPRVGLLDALGEPQLMQIAETSSYPGSRESLEEIGISPLRWHAGQVGLLDTLNTTEIPPDDATQDEQGTLQIIGRYPIRSTGPKRSDDNTVLLDAGKQFVGGIAQGGKDLWTGVRLGNSSLWRTAANAVSLFDAADNFLVPVAEAGTVTPDPRWQGLKDGLKDWLEYEAALSAPPAEDQPKTLPSAINAAVGSAPAELAQALSAVKIFGTMRGLGALGALKESDKGPMASAEGAARGLLFGKAFQLAPVLSTAGRASSLAALGAADSAAQGGDANDILSSALTMGALATLGSPRKITHSEEQIVQLRNLLNEYHLARLEYLAKKEVLKRLAPEIYKRKGISFNKKIGAKVEQLGRQTYIAEGQSVGSAPRYYVSPKNWRQGDLTLRDDSDEPISIVDFKHGRESAVQKSKDKKVPLPTTYVNRREVIRRAEQILRKHGKR